MKNVQTDVNDKPCNHEAILISAPSFFFSSSLRHFDPHPKKETTKKQKPNNKLQNSWLTIKHEKCLETKTLRFFLQLLYYLQSLSKKLVYFWHEAIHRLKFIYRVTRKKLKIVIPAVKRDEKNVITQTHLRCNSWKLDSEVRIETL